MITLRCCLSSRDLDGSCPEDRNGRAASGGATLTRLGFLTGMATANIVAKVLLSSTIGGLVVQSLLLVVPDEPRHQRRQDGGQPSIDRQLLENLKER